MPEGTGYGASPPFLPFWKVFRNLAYSLYIIMFVVVGIMIMLRTKVNAQTIITIQTALPNLPHHPSPRNISRTPSSVL